jgi:hypothetical protein
MADTTTIDQHPDNPPHIHRADLIAALDLIAISDPSSVRQVVLGTQHVDVTRYDKPMRVDPATDDVVTITHRIEII